MRAPGGPTAVAFGLLSVATAAVVLSAAADVAARATSPESVVRGYFAALERGDEQAALATIEPLTREAWAPFVANILLHTYRVEGVAVHEASLLQRQGARAGPQDVTIFVRVTEWVDGAEWLGTPRVPLVKRAEGGWFLTRPPLSPES